MAVTRLYFKIPASSSATTYTIDLARELSKHHRCLIRQKQMFTVYGGQFLETNNNNANLYISTAPNTWVTKRAVNRGFRAWKKQVSGVMTAKADGLRTGSHSDFKVLLDSGTTSNYLKSLDASDTELPSGEWDYTTMTMPREDQAASDGSYVTLPSDQFEVMICGPHTGSGNLKDGTGNIQRVGLIQSWINSRPVPQHNTDEPNTNPEMDGDPLHRMFAFGDADEDEKIVDAINDENDTPPYDLDVVLGATDSTGNGANLQMQCLASVDTSIGSAQIIGFNAICGLLRIHVTGTVGANGGKILLDVESNGVGF